MENAQKSDVELMENAICNAVESTIKENYFSFDVGNGANKKKVQAHDYVDVDTLSDTVQDIVFRIEANDFRYEVFDFMMGYYVIKLFTNIPIPMMEDSIDYAKCYDICTRLNLINRLCEKSANIAEYISVIEKNVWRKLEYDKAMQANENMNILYGRVYNFIDNLDNTLDNLKELGFDKIASELVNVTNNLSFIDKIDNKNEEA